MRISVAVLVCLLLPLGPAAADDEPSEPPKPATLEQAADAALAAFESKDTNALKALALKDEPDPWLVADELCYRGEHDAAEAFAKAAPRKAVEQLPAYLASRRGQAPDVTAREVLAAMQAALAKGEIEVALASAESIDDPAGHAARIHVAYGRGQILAKLKRLETASRWCLKAADAARAIGWMRRAGEAYLKGGQYAYRRSDRGTAYAAIQKAVPLLDALGDRAGTGTGLRLLGALLGAAGKANEARDHLLRGIRQLEAAGDDGGVLKALLDLASVLFRMAAYREAVPQLERAKALAERLGDRWSQAASHRYLGKVYARLGNAKAAMDNAVRAGELFEAVGDRRMVAWSDWVVAENHMQAANYPAALEANRRALEIFEELGDKRGIAGALNAMAIVQTRLGNYQDAQRGLTQVIAIAEALGLRGGLGSALDNLGAVHLKLGDHEAALAARKRALALYEEVGDRSGIANTYGNMGIVYEQIGKYAKALACYQRALELKRAHGEPYGIARSLQGIGEVHGKLGDFEQALRRYTEARDLFERAGRRLESASLHTSIGLVHESRGDHDDALEHYNRALAAYEDLRVPWSVCVTLGNIGNIQLKQREYGKALETYRRAQSMAEAGDDPIEPATLRLGVGSVHLAQGALDDAEKHYTAALRVFRDVGARPDIVRSLLGLSRVAFARKNWALAIARAREAVELLPRLVGGLGERQGATAREQWSDVFSAGTRASLAADSAADLAFFLESDRAGTLREGLRAREALWSVLVPKALRGEEATARAREHDAVERLRAAVRRGKLKEVRQARTALNEARSTLEAVIARIQRTAKAGAAIAYPQADDLATLRGRLKEGEALILYGLTSVEALALVVEPESARIVALGTTREVGDAAASLALHDSRVDPSRALAALRRLLVTPLGLGEGIKRVLVAPAGVLGYVPFPLLLEDKLVACVPSGTTYGLLLSEEIDRGDGILAVGDPDYLTQVDKHALALRERGGTWKLAPLPGTRKEIEAIGDVLLAGKDATESRFEAEVKRRTRWRAVHFACHGLVDPERPMFSSLALTADGESDGFLTALEIFRMKVPADLAVLSACETGKGRVYKSEGIVGLTRAFMFAGAPRVICSLWKVDDEATRALMVKFYELWTAKNGGKGLGAAAALKQAQEFVRNHKEWEHPYFWAAWVLWGLAN